jgi:hypothetical protein
VGEGVGVGDPEGATVGELVGVTGFVDELLLQPPDATTAMTNAQTDASASALSMGIQADRMVFKESLRPLSG